MNAKRKPNRHRAARTRRHADWRNAIYFHPSFERLEDRRVLAWYNGDLPADVNDDGSVTSNDIYAMVSVLRGDPDFSITIGPEDPLPPEGYVNPNDDSVVDVADFDLVYSAYEAIYAELEVIWEEVTLPPPALDFTVSGGDVTEPLQGVAQMTFTVTLNAPQAEEVILGFFVSSEAATYGLDFGNVTGPGGTVPEREVGELVFAPGATSASITVDILPDDLPEATEAIFCHVGSSDVLHDASGSILDNDEPLPALSIADVTLDEALGTFSFSVTLSYASAQTVSVNYTTANGTAQAGSDLDYLFASGTLDFSPGETSLSITVPVGNDSRDEFDETFQVSLASPLNATLEKASATGTIVDDDLPPTVTFTAASVNSSASEDDGLMTLTVQ